MSESSTGLVKLSTSLCLFLSLESFIQNLSLTEIFLPLKKRRGGGTKPHVKRFFPHQ